MNQQTVALTGATGFIGGALLQALIDAGYHVRALVRPQSSSVGLPDPVDIVSGDFNDTEALGRLLNGAGALLHCAGTVRGATRAAFDNVNALGVRNLVATAEGGSIDKVLFISSLAAREPHLSPYAASKRAGEAAIASSALRDVAMILRPPAVYGIGDREMTPLFKAMARGIAPVWGRADARFSLLHIDDLVEFVMSWLATPERLTGCYELDDGCERGYNMADVVEVAERVFGRRIWRLNVPDRVLGALASCNVNCARVMGYAPMLTPWKVKELSHPDWVCDNTAVGALSSWRPQVQLEAGLRQLRESFRGGA